MDIRHLLDNHRTESNILQIQRSHLIWMLLLRVLLYTGVLALSFIFQGAQFDVILMPRTQLILLLLLVGLDEGLHLGDIRTRVCLRVACESLDRPWVVVSRCHRRHRSAARRCH